MKHLFILGSFRSGTTAIAEILSKHSECVITSESLIYEDTQTVNRINSILNDFNSNNINVGTAKTFKNNLKQNIKKFKEYCINRKFKSITEFETLMCKLSIKKNIKYIGDKFPEYVFSIQRLNKIYPNSKFIMCIRDPRDVIVSQTQRYRYCIETFGDIGVHWWAKKTIEECINMEYSWLKFIRAWDESKSSIKGYELYYKNLILDKENEALRLAEFLDINADELKVLFKESIYSTKYQIWKRIFPNITDKLPKTWLDRINKW